MLPTAQLAEGGDPGGGIGLELYSETANTHICIHLFLHTCAQMCFWGRLDTDFAQLCFKLVFVSINEVFLFVFCMKLIMKCNEDWHDSPAEPIGIQLQGTSSACWPAQVFCQGVVCLP